MVSIVRLHLTSGESAQQKTAFEFSQPEIVLGRDPGTDVVLSSGGVSRRHARLIWQGSQCLVEDLGSSNGTFLNGKPVQGTVVLANGDRLQLGQSVEISIELVAEEAPSASRTVSASAVSRQSVPPDRGETVLGDDVAIPGAGHSTPHLSVTIAGSQTTVIALTKDVFTIGRAEDNDIVVPSKIISRYHARLERVGDLYQLVPSPDAGNPILFEGRPLQETRSLRHEDKFRIGSLDPGSMVTFSYESPSDMAAGAGASLIRFGEAARITIGRDLSNDITLDAPNVSRFHAVIEKSGQRYLLRDLQSANGTFVNDQPLTDEAWINPEDAIRVGPYRFVVGEDQIAQYDETGGLRVEAIGLNKWVRKDLNILQNISVIFQPREFIVVVGQSGGGKSTLVDSIAGYRPATHGKVFVNDVDIYKHFDAIRNDIGFVPQKDIIHTELTIEQALDYSAQLRMPRDTTKAERHERILEVLEDLDLVHRKDVQISGLSGGQLKRVSIGVELLTKPGLFFLDEPTSGLDPGTETSLMQLMRRLADQGRTIVLITHATKNVMLADKVIFLARGGYLAWFGPPDEALEYFNQYRSDRAQRSGEMEFDEIYALLDDPSLGSPADWAERYHNHSAYQRHVLNQLDENRIAQARSEQDVQPAKTKTRVENRQISSPQQFLILSSRNFKILTRDRFSLALLLAAAPLVALLQVILSFVMGRNVMDYTEGHMPFVLVVLFLLPVYAVMVAGLGQMREIVKEADVYKRERLINLKIIPYVLSKVWIAALLALYQSAAYVIVQYLAFNMPGGGVEFGLIYVTMALAAMAGMMLGLFASALAPNANSAPLLVILMILPQIVLGGALIPLPEYISGLTSTRWALQSMVSVTGVGSDVASDLCWQLPPEQRSLLTSEDKETICPCMGTNILRKDSCDFPGLGIFYTPAIDEAEPQPPPPLPPQPEEPQLPERPVQPADQSDADAMSAYFDELNVWEAEANRIQDDYRAEVAQYQAQAEVFQQQAVVFQTDHANWQIAQAGAVEPAENLLATYVRDYGFNFVDKNDSLAYTLQLAVSWGAQILIIVILFVATVIMMKRKDVI